MKRNSRTLRNDAAMAATILVLGLLLTFAGLILNERWHSAARRNQAPMFEDLLGAVATAAGLAVVAWWIATFLLAIAIAVLQQSGKGRGANAAAKLSPAFMRRLAVAILGLHLMGVPLANATPALVEPTWSQQTGPSEIEPHWQPRAPVTEPNLLGSVPQRGAVDPAWPGQATVVVTRGDSLWSIAARQLGPFASDVEIALHWPQWYAANRQVIGDDPGLLVPGQLLQPPPGN